VTIVQGVKRRRKMTSRVRCRPKAYSPGGS
jgi:hypothetical protein